MKLIKPSAEILQITELPLNLIEQAGRTCYKSEEKICKDSNIAFTEMILKRGHESVIEHAHATVKFICDRGVSHEIVRHRIASYSQESTRYCDYEGGHVTFIIPDWVSIGPGEFSDIHPACGEQGDTVWFTAMQIAEQRYKMARTAGWKPEQARSVLPNSLKTEVIMSANLREFRHFFKLRTAKAAHPSMREVAIPLLAEFKSLIPVLFDDIL